MTLRILECYSLPLAALGCPSSCLQLTFLLQLPKIDLDKTEVREKDVHLANLYDNQVFIMVIVHPATSAGSNPASASTTDIHLFSVSKDGTSIFKTHILVRKFLSS